jgi:hypothetical protein
MTVHLLCVQAQGFFSHGLTPKLRLVLPLSRHPGVIRVKADPATASNILKTLMPFLQKHSERSFADTLIIVSQRGVRWVKTA